MVKRKKIKRKVTRRRARASSAASNIKRYKVGILVGAVVGAVAAGYAISQGYADLGSVAESGKGLLDSIMSRNAAIEVAQYKVYMVFTFVGAVFGYLVDVLIESLR